MDERVLRIYVATHCDGCRESRRLAKVVAACLPSISVEVINIDHQKPVDDIFAVPTFCYRGKILSLGNPSENELCSRIIRVEQRRAGATSPEAGDVAARQAAGILWQVEPAKPGQGHASRRLTACGGAAGIGGTVLCSASMAAPALGLVAAARPSMSQAGQAGVTQAPGWFTAFSHLGPEILVLSILVMLVAVALRRWTWVLPVIVGGIILYLGMYVQPNLALMCTSMVAGMGLLVAAYVASLRTDFVPNLL